MDITLEIEQRRHRLRELRHEILFVKQQLVARKVRYDLDKSPDNRIRELETSIALSKLILAERQAEIDAQVERAKDFVEEIEYQGKVVNDGDLYLDRYAIRLEKAKIANAVKAERAKKQDELVGCLAIVKTIEN